MKILILTNYSNGLYLFRKELLEVFKNEGHEILVSVPFDENTHKLEEMGLKLINTPLDRHGINPFKDFMLLLFYFRLIKKEKPGIILTYTIKPNIYGAIAARILRRPYICNVTGLGTAIENGGILSKVLIKLYSFSMGKAKRVFFQNEHNKAFMQSKNVAVKSAALLPGSGVNLESHPFREYPSEEDGIRLLAVIRIMKDKGIEEYLSAAKSLSSKHPKVRFELVGEYEEDERQKYESEINRLCAEGVIKYYGHIDNVEEVMAKSHIIVHPSYHEGLSNVLLEAGACGRPVVATNVSGCIETFEDGKSGFSCLPRDAQSLITTLEKMLSLSESDRRNMGEAARKWVKDNFDRRLVIDAYLKEIGSV